MAPVRQKVTLYSNVPWYNDEIANLEMRFRQRLKGKINGILLYSLKNDRSCYLQQCGMMNALIYRCKQTYYLLYNDVKATCVVIGGCP